MTYKRNSENQTSSNTPNLNNPVQEQTAFAVNISAKGIGMNDKLKKEIFKIFSPHCKDYMRTASNCNCESALTCHRTSKVMQAIDKHIKQGAEKAAEKVRDIVYMRDKTDAYMAAISDIEKLNKIVIDHRGIGQRQILAIILKHMIELPEK